MSDALVSVLIPAFNHGEFLRLAVHDALSQTHANLEVLVGDDASLDDTESVVAEFDDPRLSYWRRDTNLGAGANVRALLQAARGEYVAILNDDDRWDADLLATLLPPIEDDHTVVASFSRYSVIDASGVVLEAATHHSEEALGLLDLAPGRHQPFLTQAVSKSIPSNLCTVFRHSVLIPSEIPDDVGAAYDLWLSYLACRAGGAVVFVNRRCAHFRIHATSATALGGPRISSAEVAVYRRFLADSRLASEHRRLRKSYASILLAAAHDQHAAGERARSACLALRSARVAPTLGALRALLVLGRPVRAHRNPQNPSSTKVSGAMLEATRRELLPFVPRSARTVLDVGCATGAFGQSLRQERALDCLWGIEPRPDAAAIAANRYDHVAIGLFPDVVCHNWPAFDCIMFNDVLEHTTQPERCLEAAKELLGPNGHVVACIPNVRFAELLVDLVVKGNWTYQDSGLLDRTHVRFFTKRSMIELFEGSGLIVNTITPINKFVSHGWTRLLSLLGHRVDEFTHMQFVVDASAPSSVRSTLEPWPEPRGARG